MRRRQRPTTNLFMLMSVDGKISPGDSDSLDVDANLSKIAGVKEGLYQYYDLEKKTDFVSFNTGRTMAKIGVNTRKAIPKKIDCQFIIIDNKPHLTTKGVQYLTQWVQHLYLVTTNAKHPAHKIKADNLTIIEMPKLDLKQLFNQLWTEYKIRKVTIQSGGTMNASLIREGLIDQVSIVVAPLIIGGQSTSTLVDGESLHSSRDLDMLRPLKLVEALPLKHSYLLLRYAVEASD